MKTVLKSFALGALLVWSAKSIQAQTFVPVPEKNAYDTSINNILREKKDVWGDQIMASGEASYEKVKDLLHPLFYSIGHTSKELGIHSILYAASDASHPMIVALANGSRLCLNNYASPNDMTLKIGPNGEEIFGSDVKRLIGPYLTGGFYPILKVGYTFADGVTYTQESFALPPVVNGNLVTMVKLSVKSEKAVTHRINILHGTPQNGTVAFSSGDFDGTNYRKVLHLKPNKEETIYYFWQPEQPIAGKFEANKTTYEKGKKVWMDYWNSILKKGFQFSVPEKIVEDCQKNLLIQNLMLRQKYSFGGSFYDGWSYQPECGDASTTLSMYNYPDEARGLLEFLSKTAFNAYSNWEKGEQLSHAAAYYAYTHDQTFIKSLAPVYNSYLQDFQNQILTDKHGLLEPQALSSDIATKEYYVYHQGVAWRGMRDMSAILNSLGLLNLENSQHLVSSFKDSIDRAVTLSKNQLDEHTLFMPMILFDEKKEVYSPVTATVLGSYWNLCMPYAYDSGIIDFNGKEMDDILNFMYKNGSFLLGMLRFNFFGTPIGYYNKDFWMQGYQASGVDNVYLLSFFRVLAQRDDVGQMLLAFYNRLANGQARNTFVSGEGDNIAPVPDVEDFRVSCGSVNSANNSVFLQMLRLMLIRESLNSRDGSPETLHLAFATPREWLEDGKTIEFKDAPTLFGPVSGKIVSKINHGFVKASLTIPQRDSIKGIYLKLRLPNRKKITRVSINGKEYRQFDPATEIIDLTGCAGELDIKAICQ